MEAQVSGPWISRLIWAQQGQSQLGLSYQVSVYLFVLRWLSGPHCFLPNALLSAPQLERTIEL